MSYPSIRIEGAILSPDILSQIEELPGQRPTDFGLDSSDKVKDEIARAWADAQDYWRIFQRKLETVKKGNATTETRNLWMVPLLGLLRYDIEYQPRGTELNGQLYAISHRATNRADTLVQIIGYRDPAGLDRKPATATRRMSAHALVQEFLNLNEQLYGFVTDGHVLRLLRDSSRLVKLSYLEFDLDRIFTDSLFADFAVLYRLLQATRLPQSNDTAAESLIERYHQDSLDSGARIREGLSNAVEQAILDFGNGFLSHPDNEAIRTAVANGELPAGDYYQQLLRLIYRLLFLMVIEERDLVFPTDAPKEQRDIHRHYYSVVRLRRLSEKRYLADRRRHDLWLALQVTFRLFETDGPGQKLGIAPLAGDLFSPAAVRSLSGCTLGNDVLLKCLRALGLYRHPDSGQLIRVNYAALNVEEFGSVYEGLLEYEPEFTGEDRDIGFSFRKGEERAATGSHYTPDELVQPLIRHSLDHLIAECLKSDDPQVALLDLRVADIACGSGHILLAAARRIATELAVVRTGEEQPSPPAYRTALRDSIRQCIYGVDLNPLAVELCKVALWLEAHIPGLPLNFLDHHIKCGNAIVGFARREELGMGVSTEAFKTLAGDDKEIAAAWRKSNKSARKDRVTAEIEFPSGMRGHLDAVLDEWRSLSALPEDTPVQIDAKKDRFAAFAQGEHAELLRTIADIPVAQFYIHKVAGNEAKLVTDTEFRGYWRGSQALQGQGAQAARSLGEQKRFFHWFLEFPEIMEQGGFDCILGNPPYLGGKKLSNSYGYNFCNYVTWAFKPAGLSNLVVFFLIRFMSLLKTNGYAAFITTNSIKDGTVRRDGLENVLAEGNEIAMANRGINWPGQANVVVTLLSIARGKHQADSILDGRSVSRISALLEDEGARESSPLVLSEQANRGYMGSVLKGDGFLISQRQAEELISESESSSDVVFRFINGKDITTNPGQGSDRWVVCFHDWDESVAGKYEAAFLHVMENVKPHRLSYDENKNSESRKLKKYWWLFGRYSRALYENIEKLDRCFVATSTTKHLSFSAVGVQCVFQNTLFILALDRWDVFAVAQSTLHEVWARKYSGSNATTLRYSPSDCFGTFAFPAGLWQTADSDLAEIGERYHEYRKVLMQSLWLGLTKIYNLFHAADLTPEMVSKVSRKDADTTNAGYEALLELRRMHVEMDLAIRDAYGWQDLDLEHDFYEVETLPEKDRVRFTISTTARREVLKRLLSENKARAAAEAKSVDSKSKLARRKSSDRSPDLFGGES